MNRLCPKKYLFLLCAFMAAALKAQEYDIVANWLRYSDAQNSLYHYYAEKAFALLAQRQADIARLKTLADWQRRQSHVRETLLQLVGPFPERTPLHAVVTGTVVRPDYRVEKILFESQPDFYVTCCLFLPRPCPEKAPAILYCSGHSAEAFRSAIYQTVIINLVKKGFIVFAFDPVGQGERVQYLDPVFRQSKIGGPTKEHSYPGAQCFLIGSSLAKHMIWDGMRAVDYLLTRPEVDGDRIGITGRSGGGTQSAYIAAFDDRISASAPECYITGFKRLLESIGPQDAEQNFLSGLARGIDHADLLQVRAPKPTLIISTSRDFFSIQGAIETAEETQLVYDQYHMPDNLRIATDDSSHVSTRQNREALYSFFLKALRVQGDSTEIKVTIHPPAELCVTDAGQVADSRSNRFIFHLNAEQAAAKIALLDQRRVSPEHPQKVRTFIQAQFSDTLPGCLDDVYCGSIDKPDYRIEKRFLKTNDYVLPFVILRPKRENDGAAILYIDERGLQSAAREPWIVPSVRRGRTIIIPDLLGYGECGPGKFRGDAYHFGIGVGDFNIWFFGILLGESLVHVRTKQIIDFLHYLENRAIADARRLTLIGKGRTCAIVQHAATVRSFGAVILIEPLLSYGSLVLHEYYKPEFIHASVPDALSDYDLIDLSCCIAPVKQLILNPVDHLGEPLAPDRISAMTKPLVDIYIKHGCENNLAIKTTSAKEQVDSILEIY
ncbi:acetylxylan esterase [candidate division KSB1 bacterium]|nr:acetylxylan esterase [candidate division KSB1 bacterium]RQW08157.1 MAG: xylan esterase [candidate division KSB1 bacterium]